MLKDIEEKSLPEQSAERTPEQQKVWELLERYQGRIAAEIRVMLGEAPVAETNFTPENQQRRIKALQEAQQQSDLERHDGWMKMHLESGWVYGPEFNAKEKIHPNLLPWGQLPPATRSKAKIFALIAAMGAELEQLV